MPTPITPSPADEALAREIADMCGFAAILKRGSPIEKIAHLIAAHVAAHSGWRDALPQSMIDAALKMGKVTWVCGPGSKEEHLATFKDCLEITAKDFKQGEVLELNGVQLDSTGYYLCITGTSPNSGANAATLVALWNWLVDQAALPPAPTNKE